MGFGSRSNEPRWEDDIVFVSKRKPHHHHYQGSSRTHVTETIIQSHRRPEVEYVQMPPQQLPAPVRTPSPPPPPVIVLPALPPPPPAETRIELVSVEEDPPMPRKSRSHAPSSHASSSHSSHTRHGSSRGGGDEVYIERERIRERVAPPPSPPSREEYETFRYVPGPGPRPRRNSADYDEGNRVSTRRIMEREQIRAVDDEGRRRNYYGRD